MLECMEIPVLLITGELDFKFCNIAERMQQWDFCELPIAPKISLATDGNVETSPVYSTSSVGCCIDGAVFAKAAFKLRPDQVDNAGFRGAVAGKSDGAVNRGARVLTPQGPVGTVRRIDRQIEAAGIGVGAPHGHDRGVSADAAQMLVGACFGFLARVQAGGDEILRNRVEPGDARALPGAITSRTAPPSRSSASHSP